MSAFDKVGGMRWYFDIRHFWDNFPAHGHCMLCGRSVEKASAIVAWWGENIKQEVGITPQQIVDAQRIAWPQEREESYPLYLNEEGKLQIRKCLLAATFRFLVGVADGDPECFPKPTGV